MSDAKSRRAKVGRPARLGLPESETTTGQAGEPVGTPDTAGQAPPPDNPLAKRNALIAAAHRLNALAEDYWAEIDPLCNALVPVLITPLDDRDAWTAAVHTAAAEIRRAGLADVSAELRSGKGQGDYAAYKLAGWMLCDLFDAAVRGDRSRFDGRLGELSADAAWAEVPRQLSDIVYSIAVRVPRRIAPLYYQRAREIVFEAGGSLMHLTDELAAPNPLTGSLTVPARLAVNDWNEVPQGGYYSGWCQPSTRVRVARAQSEAEVAELSAGGPAPEPITAPQTPLHQQSVPEDFPLLDGPDKAMPRLRWENDWHPVKGGIVHRLLIHMWDREVAPYDDLMGAHGAVWDSEQLEGTVRGYCNKANADLPTGVPWKLSANSTTRFVTKKPRG